MGSGADTRGGAILSSDAQPWGEKAAGKERSEKVERRVLEGPIPGAELGAIATESSQRGSAVQMMPNAS
ncbi:MAG: hypothetical protein WDN23_08510 [Edaphobacter sp.]